MGRLGPGPPRAVAIRGLVTAVRFLTIVPIPGRALEGPDALGRAAAWFPLVGLALGGLLWFLDGVFLLRLEPPLAALLVLLGWKLLTGGIHLDGLADSLDGLAGRAPAERLAIMRDGRIGTFGALGLVFALLAGFVVLSDLGGEFRGPALVLAPAVGRLAPLLLARTFAPATRGEGSGAAFMESAGAAGLVLGGIAVGAASALLAGPWGLLLAALGLAVAWAAGAFFSRRLGGLTGDVLGAVVEVVELVVLLAFAGCQYASLQRRIRLR